MVHYIDFETRSRANLKGVGAWKYAFDPSTEVLCLVVVSDEDLLGKPFLWIPHQFGLTPTALSHIESKYLVEIGEGCPSFFKKAIDRGDIFVAHNAEFELAMWTRLMMQYGFPKLPIQQVRDTMALAARSGLPLSLEGMCEVMDFPITKDMEGAKIMKKMCKPIPMGKRKGEWHYTPEDHARLIDYCVVDVVATQGAYHQLPPLKPFEQRVWEETIAINYRGLPIDEKSIDKLIAAEKINVEHISLELALATDWEISASDMKRSKFLCQWLEGYGIHTTSINKENVTRLLQTDLPKVVRQVLEARQQLGRSATAKYATMKDMICEDKRIRGTFTYCGATKTGRFAGRGIQPHNLVRPMMGNGDIDKVYSQLEHADGDELRTIVTSQMKKNGKPFQPAEVFSSLIRGAIKAPEGKVFMAADYSAIEARGVFWLAECEKGLDIFAKSDAGTGPEPYVVMAADIFGVDAADVEKGQRQVGKQAILGCHAFAMCTTNNGRKQLITVKGVDRVWNGAEWCDHQGVAFRGYRKVSPFLSTLTTHDHKFDTGFAGWKELWQLEENNYYLWSAIHTGVSQSATTSWDQTEGSARSLPNARAALCENILSIMSLVESLLGVGNAPWNTSDKGTERDMDTSKSCPMINSEKCGSIATPRSSHDVINLIARFSDIMADEVYAPQMLGLIEDNFSETLCKKTDGMTLALNLIGSITMGLIHLRTLDSSLDQEISRTGEGILISLTKVKNCVLQNFGGVTSQMLQTQVQCLDGLIEGWTLRDLSNIIIPVFDLVEVTNGNAFEINTGYGPLRSHNCGYGMQGPKFEMTCDGYGIVLPDPPQKYLSTYQEKWERQCENARDRGVDLPSFSPKGQFIVDKYRQAFPEVVEYWNDIGDAAIRATKTQGSIEKVGAVAFKFMEVGGKPFLLCRLPSGRSLWYFNPTIKKTMAPWGSLIDSLHYECMASMKSGGKAWMEISTYGAHLVENVCQAVCRDLLVYSIINVTDSGLEPILHIHDELVVECPAPKGSGDLAQYERLVAETPEWADGFPVAAAGWIHNRYQKD